LFTFSAGYYPPLLKYMARTIKQGKHMQANITTIQGRKITAYYFKYFKYIKLNYFFQKINILLIE
jgi:hypothetical protein